MTGESTGPSAPLAVPVVSPVPRDVWRRVAESDPYTLPTQMPEWTDAVVEARGFVDASRWYVTPDGRDLVLPLARRRLGGLRALQSSFAEGWGNGGILAEGGPSESDVRLVIGNLAKQQALRTSIHPNPLLADKWQAAAIDGGALAKTRLSHVVDLTDGADAVWNDRMASQARRGVRRARKLGVEVTRDSGGELIPIFYEMLLQSFGRWAARQHEPRWIARLRNGHRDPREKFDVIVSRLGPAYRLYVARHEGRPAAAVLVLMGANAQYLWGAMDAEVGGRSNANDLLHWTAIQDSCAAGCAEYHMGESAVDSTLARYKEKLGARPVPYAEYFVERVPVTRMDRALRGLVKRAIGFRDV